ncbi:hypothetical protein QBD01_000093 [Ochrobactrum sp. 19YEA23]|nr:hypothetical protein [Ochrobactrum sp. 19YEA23]
MDQTALYQPTSVFNVSMVRNDCSSDTSGRFVHHG